MVLFLLTIAFLVNAQPIVGAKKSENIANNFIRPDVERQCGVSMRVPDLRYVYDQPIGFGCTGSYKDEGRAILDMDIQYDPNQNSGGARITFVVERVGIDEKIKSGGDSVFSVDNKYGTPTLRSAAAYGGSNCGPATGVQVTPINGINWHGWIAEEKFEKTKKGCHPEKEFTNKYRCVHVMVGNDVMTAQLTGVCLLRSREFSLENGFSYDIFIDMIKSMRFIEG